MSTSTSTSTSTTIPKIIPKIIPTIILKSEQNEKLTPLITLKKSEKGCTWYCYVIFSENKRTYIGKTNDLIRRLRQHNGEIAGGAKSTRNRGPFHLAFYVHGFETEGQALCFEWAMHHGGGGSRRSRRKPGLKGAVKALVKVTNRPRWTRKCPPASEIPLTISWNRHLLGSLEKVSTFTSQFPEYISHCFELDMIQEPVSPKFDGSEKLF